MSRLTPTLREGARLAIASLARPGGDFGPRAVHADLVQPPCLHADDRTCWRCEDRCSSTARYRCRRCLQLVCAECTGSSSMTALCDECWCEVNDADPDPAFYDERGSYVDGECFGEMTVSRALEALG